jgi:hypothetical protein
VDMHDYFTVASDWLREFFVSRRFPKRVQNRSMHRGDLRLCQEDLIAIRVLKIKPLYA